MKRSHQFLLSCLLGLLSACAQKPSAIQDDDAIPTNIPLPLAGVNQQPVVGVKTVLLIAGRWAGDREVNMTALYAGTFAQQPGSVYDYLLKASMGKLILQGTTIQAQFPMPADSGFNGEMKDAEAAARAQGYEPNNYDYVWIAHDNGTGGAQGEMPGRRIAVRDSRYGGHYIWAHEFGHNLGYSHEADFGGLFDTYVNCPAAGNSVTAPEGCGTKRYGDTGDPVQGSNAVPALYPANNRWYAGWLDDSQAAVINKTGLYRLGVLGHAGPQLYLIDRGANKSPKQIALEYRQPTPPYDNFSTSDNRVSGVWVRYTTMGERVSNVQLDGTPQTVSTADPTFLPGHELADAAALIYVCSTDTKGATIAVTLLDNGRPSCTPVLSRPTVAIPGAGQQTGYKPIVSGTGMPGTTVQIERTRDGYMVGVVGSAIVGADGKWSAQLDQALAAGAQHLAVYSTNPGSPNSSNISSATFSVIETPASPTIENQPAFPGPLPLFSGTGLPGASIFVEKTNVGNLLGVVATAVVDQEGKWSAQSLVAFPAGTSKAAVYQQNGDKRSPVEYSNWFYVQD